uniref:Uncharacterized protein n=1 Tax=Siphoviridae sp. ctTkm23 TaxID=2825522 RepID=A0A8S5TRQ8_9CAUD|nr:MAG TPA: hypothetical protein [Siphoviridae sp. ctTkm23]
MHSLYETVCFAVFFPLILLFGASGKITDPYTDRIKYVGSWIESPTPCTGCITRSSNLYYAWVKNRDSFHPNALPSSLEASCWRGSA